MFGVKKVPLTLLAGLAIIIACEILLFIDVHNRGGVVVGPAFPDPDRLPMPQGYWAEAARSAAFNMTGICWVAYLLVFDGLLQLVPATRRESGSSGIAAASPLNGGSPVIARKLARSSPLRLRPNRFLVAWLTSISVWCFFDWVNFTGMHAWTYYGLPPEFAARLAGYFIAFAAISPGMFLAAELYQRLGLARWRTPHAPANQRAAGLLMVVVTGILAVTVALVRLAQPKLHATVLIGRMDLGDWLAIPGIVLYLVTRSILPGIALRLASLVLGATFTLWAVLVGNPLANLTLWVGLVFLIDPINGWLGGDSLLEDWRAGRWGRMTSLMIGGVTCGLLWEFWNYWALSKWSYSLPFLGHLEHYRCFEMPALGFLGFLPFAMECWVVLNLILVVLARLGLRVAEPLPDDAAVI
jgi:hypothetical protein